MSDGTMRPAAQVAIPVIDPRAVVGWVLVRLLVAALPLAAGGPCGSISPPPAAVVVLAGIVGLVDVRVRGERLLWANLGVTVAGLWAMYAAAAIPAEFLLALVRR